MWTYSYFTKSFGYIFTLKPWKNNKQTDNSSTLTYIHKAISQNGVARNTF